MSTAPDGSNKAPQPPIQTKHSQAMPPQKDVERDNKAIPSAPIEDTTPIPNQQLNKEPPTPPSKHQLESTGEDGSSEDDDCPLTPNKVFEDALILPSEDVKTYGDLIRKVASALGLPILDPQERVDDVIIEVLNRDVSAPVSLPLSSVLLQSIQTAWSNSGSAPTSTKCLDHMYRVHESSAAFLYTYPKPNSLIVSSAAKGREGGGKLMHMVVGFTPPEL